MSHLKKVVPLRKLAGILDGYRKEGKTIVHCHGVFDLLHIGHIRHFTEARGMGDVLVVTVTPDRYVDKGPHRPAFTETLRAEAIASMNIVDHVAINEWRTAEETLRLLRPDIFVKGSEFRDTSSDMTGKVAKEEQVVAEIGARIAFTEDIVFSSSNLINRYLKAFPEDVDRYLSLFRRRHSIDQVSAVLDRMAELKVLVIGDTILDDYHYCSVIGKSSKDPILVMQYQSNDLFVGGILAVANHLAGFAGEVQLVTVLGEVDRQESFIRDNLLTGVTPLFWTQPGAPTLMKRRFIEGYSFNKLFEVYVMDGSGLPPDADNQLREWLHSNLPKYDLVVAGDFGHGAISAATTRMLEEHSRLLAVNTQANAGNRGFHTISRYNRADYACIAEHELRLEMRDLKSSVHQMVHQVADRLGCAKFALTRGRKGCLIRSAEGETLEVPAFAHNVVDRVGAGDAFFAVTALAVAQDVDDEIIGFLGSAVGCLAVEIVGNRKSIDKTSLKKYITSVMK